MNTANLQLQGILATLASLLHAIESKGVLTRGEIAAALDRAEADAAAGARPHEGLTEAHIDAVRFPARYLREALNGGARSQSFAEVTHAVGERKDDGRQTRRGS
jgi:hypothetical protein